MRRKISYLIVPLFFVFSISSINGQATRIMGDGPDEKKIVIGVIGDGYDASDLANGEYSRFSLDVKRLVKNGLFADDVFGDPTIKKAFNVYQIEALSNQSGVSTPSTPKDTALRMKFNGQWERCWIEATPTETPKRLKSHVGSKIYNYLIVILNNGDSRGGCYPGGNILYVTNGVDPAVITHEMGHAFGSLYDEYAAGQILEQSPTEIINSKNCSNVVSRENLSWKKLLTPGIDIPTGFSSAISDSITGMFESCNYKTKGIFRPSPKCRMKTPNGEHKFCSVCKDILQNTFSNFRKAPSVVKVSEKFFTQIEIKLTANSAEVMRVQDFSTEFDENPVLSASSNYVFELSRGSETPIVGSLAQDPFARRAFPDPNNNRGERLPDAVEATVVLRVPTVKKIDFNKDNLNLKLYKVKIEKLSNETLLKDIGPQELNILKKDQLIKKGFEIKTGDFNKLKTQEGF